MLSEQWYAVCPVSHVQRRPLPLRRFARDLVLWRGADGDVHAALDVCPHRGAALSRGRVIAGCLACPYHGLRFDDDGRCVHVPAHPADPIPDLHLRTFPVRLAQGLVWVWNGAGSPGPIPWDDAFEAELRAGGADTFLDLHDTFDVSYLRVMENLSDVHHVAHVHRWTAPVPADITRFSAHREGLDVHVNAELGGRLQARIHLRAPFLGLLDFADQARFAVVATPIDHDHVWLFARYSQSVIRIPGLTTGLTWLLGQFDYRLLQRLQDLPVWRSQRLLDPADTHRYHLLPADEGVALYFAIHQELAAS